MGGAAKGRVFRSTQTAPNAGTARDLTTAFGTTPNNTTVAAFPLAGASGLQWSPNAAAATANPPASPATAVTGLAWRDTAAEDANEQVTYAAGTWTLRVRLNKTVMTINASVTVRVTAVVFRVSSAGTFVAEIGRVVFVDTALASVGVPVSVSGSFTGLATVLAPGDKVQVEVYVQNIVAGSPAAAVAAYTAALVTDETSANSGTGFTAIPAFTTQYVRGQAEAVQGADLPVDRAIRTGRGLAEAVQGADALDRVLHALRSVDESYPVGADALDRKFVGGRAAAETVPTVTTLAIAFKGLRGISESIVTADQADRKFVGGRAPAPESVLTTHQVPDRVYHAQRAPTEVIVTVDQAPVRGFVGGRPVTEAVPTVDVVGRSIKQRRFLEEYPTGVTPDYTVTFPQRKVAGVVRDNLGAPVAGATVKLYRDLDDVAVQTRTSAGDGSYEFLRDLFDPYTYYVGAYEEVGEKTEGVTERGLVPEPV